MTYIVKPLSEGAIVLRPATRVEEILQNVAVLTSTRKGSVPLDRNLGLSQDFLDRPIPIAKPLMTAEIVEVVSAYEPRADVVSVAFEEDPSGVLTPLVEVKILDE